MRLGPRLLLGQPGKRHSLGIEVSKKVEYEPRGAGSQFATVR